MLSQLGARLRRLLSEDRTQAARLETEVGVVQLMRRVRERWDVQHNVLPVPRRFDIRRVVLADDRVRTTEPPPPALAEADWNVPLPMNCFDADGHATRLDDAFFAKREYGLGLLTSFDDAVFVSMAYRCVLKRGPDRTGFHGYLSRLRTGEFDRIDVLRSLVRSSEAEPIGVHIAALGKHDFWRRLQKLRVVGRYFEWANAIVRLPRLARRQLLIEAKATTWHRENREETRRIIGTTTGPMTASLAALELASSQMEDGLTAVADVLERLDANGRHRADDGEAEAIGFDDRLNRLDAAIELGQVRTEWLEKRFHLSPEGTAGTSGALDDASIARLCAEVEARLRGGLAVTQADDERRFAWLDEAGLGARGVPMLDLGCGRGDWLAALHERGLDARGVDDSRALVDACRGRGLAAERADPSQWLSTAPDGSFGVVFVLHLVEAMPLVALVELLRDIHRTLVADGLLILETTDPTGLAGPSGDTRPVRPGRPVPLTPSVLEYLVGSQGFERIRIARDVDEPYRGTGRVAQSYAVVARTPSQGPLPKVSTS